MRVLMVSKACYVAAYRKKLEELAALPDVELTLVVPPYWQQGQKKAMLEPGYTSGYRMVVQSPCFNGRHHLHFYRHLPKFLEESRPDILHIDEEPYDFVTFHALRAGQRAGAKALFFTWQNIKRSFPLPFSFFEAYALQHCQAAIAGNSEAAQVLREKGFRGALFVIPQFGVDLNAYRPKPMLEDHETPFRIGFLGRLVEEKGILVLLQAVAGLAGRWQLQIVGDGPLRPQIEDLTRKLEIGDKVYLEAAIPSSAVPAYVSRLDVLVLPSLTQSNWKEQFGRVLVEAMACQVAVVGSDSGEIPNVIGEAGLIFREGNADDLRHCLRLLMEDPGLRSRLARRGRGRVETNYTQEKIAQKTYEAYREMLAFDLPNSR